MDDKIKSADSSAPRDSITNYGEKGYDVHSAASGSDLEKQDEFRAGTTVQLKRKLQSRHLQMIAIGMSAFLEFSVFH